MPDFLSIIACVVPGATSRIFLGKTSGIVRRKTRKRKTVRIIDEHRISQLSSTHKVIGDRHTITSRSPFRTLSTRAREVRRSASESIPLMCSSIALMPISFVSGEA